MSKKRKTNKKRRYTRRQAKPLKTGLRLSSKNQRIKFTPIAPWVSEAKPKAQEVRRARQTQKPNRAVTKPKVVGLTVEEKNETIRKLNVCKRRAQRKQIIHAINRSGHGGQKKPDNLTRGIKC